MKEFCLVLVLLLLPVSVLAQSVFDGTWKTNMSEAKISQKRIICALNNGHVHLRQLCAEDQHQG